MCRHHLTKGLFLRTDEFQGSESQGQHIKSLLLSSRQQDEAEGAWAQAVVELFNPPVTAPGYYLWVVLLQSLKTCFSKRGGTIPNPEGIAVRMYVLEPCLEMPRG